MMNERLTTRAALLAALSDHVNAGGSAYAVVDALDAYLTARGLMPPETADALREFMAGELGTASYPAALAAQPQPEAAAPETSGEVAVATGWTAAEAMASLDPPPPVVPAPEPAPETGADEPRYPCDRCGKLRTKAEGGTTFTVCDECWDAAAPAQPDTTPAEGRAEGEDANAVQAERIIEGLRSGHTLTVEDAHNLSLAWNVVRRYRRTLARLRAAPRSEGREVLASDDEDVRWLLERAKDADEMAKISKEADEWDGDADTAATFRRIAAKIQELRRHW